MRFTAINYFPNISSKQVSNLANVILSSEFDVSYAGKSQHPKKWCGDAAELSKLLSENDEVVNFTLLENSKGDLALTIDLYELPQSEYSIIRVTGTKRETVESLCMYFVNDLNSYACASSESGVNKWSVMHQSNCCPQFLREQLESA